MATPAHDDWAYMRMRTGLCLCHAVVLFEVWTNRKKLGSVVGWLSYMWSSIVTDERMEQRVSKMRVEKICVMFHDCKQIMTVMILVPLIIQGELACRHQLQEESDAIQDFAFRSLLTGLGVYFGFVLIDSYPPTQRVLDVGFVCLSLVPMFRVAFDGSNRWVLMTPLRSVWRPCLGVVYMKARVSTWVNLVQVLVTCWAYGQRPLFEKSAPHLCTWTFNAAELASWALTTSLCVVTESWMKNLLRKELEANDAKHAAERSSLEANDAKHAAERLLSGLCDTVVRLRPDLSISHATPQLLHLMRPTTTVSPQVLQGTSFSCLLASQADKDSFATFISNTTQVPPASGAAIEGPAEALCVNLRYAAGCEVSAELFHVYSERRLEHLIGLREVRENGISPDESLFLGTQGSGTATASEQGVMAVEQLAASRGTKSLRSSNTSSLGSSPSRPSEKHKLQGLAAIQMSLGEGFRLQEYVLFFDDTKSDLEQGSKGFQPTLNSCLTGEGKDPFLKWVTDSTNKLMYAADIEAFEYSDEVRFRPPAATCAQSKVQLCAQSATLTMVSEDGARSDHGDDADDNNEQDDDGGADISSWSIHLQLMDISQIRLCQHNVQPTSRASSQRSQYVSSQRSAPWLRGRFSTRQTTQNPDHDVDSYELPAVVEGAV